MVSFDANSRKMFGLFKKPSKEEQLQKEYRKLLEESHRLSTRDRKKSDDMAYQANEVLKKLDAIRENK